MTVQDARERAWREVHSTVNRTRLYERVNGSGKLERVQLQESLVSAIRDAAKQEDEQRIAALVAGLLQAISETFVPEVAAELWESPALVEWRALAGQTEAVK